MRLTYTLQPITAYCIDWCESLSFFVPMALYLELGLLSEFINLKDKINVGLIRYHWFLTRIKMVESNSIFGTITPFNLSHIR
jgi:hypothetical protein